MTLPLTFLQLARLYLEATDNRALEAIREAALRRKEEAENVIEREAKT